MNSINKIYNIKVRNVEELNNKFHLVKKYLKKKRYINKNTNSNEKNN